VSQCPGLSLRRCLREANRPGKKRAAAPEGRNGSPLYYNNHKNDHHIENNTNKVTNNSTTNNSNDNNDVKKN
jgi:hypothetical protein